MSERAWCAWRGCAPSAVWARRPFLNLRGDGVAPHAIDASSPSDNRRAFVPAQPAATRPSSTPSCSGLLRSPRSTTRCCGPRLARHRRDAVTGSPLWNDSLLFCPAEGSPSRCDEKLRDAVYGMPVSRISPVLWASRVLELHLRHANQSSGMAKELACTPRVNYCVW